ncbi:MAG: response regulator [Phenylobacterium sp.]|uniref:ATP-binding protein n=1 Tax=Phenylobacterium sp. TaxID=1871053 RepID=UPI001B5F92F9|nr:ATP-binding protein [Phenylobacterium sp.]MBP7814610.1 response regulator [Phenylobacterium sp.]
MSGIDSSDSTADSGGGRPFELDLSQDVCDRATRLARTLFGAVESQVVLVKDGRTWRSRDPHGTYAIATNVQWSLDTGEFLWIEDGREDPRSAQMDAVTGPPYLRFYAAAVIRLADGSIPGVICVMGQEVRPYDSSLANRLTDLAAFIADEWDRAQATKAREQGRRERAALMDGFAGVVRAMPVSLVITDKALNVVGCSPRWAAEVGLTVPEATGRPMMELRPAVFEPWREFYDRVLAGETITSDRVSYRDDDGRVRWISVEMAPWRNAEGEVGGVIAASHDISHMVEAMEATERSEQRLTLAMEIADIHVYEMDYQRRELIKAGAEDTFFSEPKTYEELYRDIYATIDPRDRPAVEAAWRRHVDEGAPYRPEYRLIRADDKEIWTSGACLLVNDRDGRPIRLIGALQNITERKEAERALLQAKEDAEMANRAKYTFLATMSHEIRTPLNGVLGMAQAMAADDLSPLQRDRLDVVRQSGETLLHILNDVLDLSKIEAGKLELEEAEFDISDLARGAHAAFTAIANKKGLSFDLAVESDARGVYVGDSTRVRQILYNLVSNALKFTESGEVRVRVARTADGLRLTVADTGIGIPPERLAGLFQKFEQADASTTRRYGGTGLGLAICRELAQLMGGAIRAESAPGEGSTFSVTLPLTKSSATHVLPAPDAGVVEATPMEVGALRVLAAEDNTVNQLVLKTLLHQIGVDPVVVANGQLAVEAWAREDWDVILMDIQMPEMDGPTATGIIRAREAAEGRARTPIIALTANAMAHQVAEYMDAGMDGFVAKPIEVGRLFAALQAVLEVEDEVEGGASVAA